MKITFYTSTQMGGRTPQRPGSPPISPLGPTAQGRHNNNSASAREGVCTIKNIQPKKPLNSKLAEDELNAINAIDSSRKGPRFTMFREGREDFGNMPGLSDMAVSGSSRNAVNASEGGDLVTLRHETGSVAMASNQVSNQETAPAEAAGTNVKAGNVNAMSLEGTGTVRGVRGDMGVEVGTKEDQKEGEVDEREGEADGNKEGERIRRGSEDEDEESIVSDDHPESDPQHPNYLEGLDEVSRRVKIVDGLISKLDDREKEMKTAVKELVHSLEFSQHEIDVLKQENVTLKQRLSILELEDRRSQFQMSNIKDKVDRLETVSKKKNLVFEGVPEQRDSRREDLEKIVGNIFDQLSVSKSINFEACYRMGPTNKSQPRAIMVTFEKQADRDAIYSRRMELKNTVQYKRVWINEDLGPLSKRKRNVIRMISKEAQAQGIDCRTGKYAIHINKEKYDHGNLDDLPLQLHPSQLKQVQLDANTIAYQSEFAPFSNFYPCELIIGFRKFFCLEQAYQFLRAKTLDKPLAALKIYLSRDVHYIKAIGNELGSSEAWESRQFVVMYECLKRKFAQNPDLKSLLLKTGNMELVEATPDRLWGCGATLSSNVIRRREWAGQNKHGIILMTVPEELRMEAERETGIGK